MPPQSRFRERLPYGDDINLPPPYTLVSLREAGDAFAHAQAIAGPDTAGTLVHVGRFDVSEFALVLEPEEPLRSARRVHYAGMVALGDALAAHAPPEKPIAFEWPGTVKVDGGLIGGGRSAWPPGTAEDTVPDWFVFGASIRIVAMGLDEPGLRPLAAALDEEGFDGLQSGRLMESFARHFMLALDDWHENGFSAIARNYIKRLQPLPGVRREIDGAGNLIERKAVGGEAASHSLASAVVQPDWLDPSTGGPRA